MQNEVIRWPEAGGIGSEHLVGQDNAGRRAPKLELGVGNNDALAPRVFSSLAVNAKAEVAQLAAQFRAHQANHLLKRDILIVPADRLGCWGEDGLRQLVGLPQAGWQFNSTHPLAGLIFLPGRAREVATNHALDRHHVSTDHQHRTSSELVGVLARRCGIVLNLRGHQMIGDNIFQEVEPKKRNLGQHAPLVRYPRGQHVIERGNSIGGYE